jgi:DNA-binding FadR family transcriptional regulator
MPPKSKRAAERPQRLGSERLHGAIARDLGIAIVSGHHQPDEILTTEIERSQDLAVSRSAYREAVRILAAKGLVESRPRAGTKVLPMARWNLLDPDVLSWLFEGDPSEAIVEGLFELRMVIEPAAAAFAAERRTGDDVVKMRTALEAMEQLTLRTPEGQAADRDFHQCVLAATRNPPLISLASTIGAGVRWTTQYKQRKSQLPPDPMPEHWAVFEAIEAGDAAEARRTMTALIANALVQTSRALGSN